MKKLLFVMTAFVAVSFASCGSKTANDSVNDSTVVDSDSAVTDSDSIVADTAFAVESITAAQ